MIRSPAGFDGADRIKRYLDYYQPSYGVMMLSAGQFSPSQLFAQGEIGAWYDPSDMTTLFQDAAGTTPVTAVEQPVGLIQDKSGNGNHASQSTSASRPVLSARVNLFLNSATLSTQNVTTVATNYTLRFEGAGSVTLSGTGSGTYNAGTHTVTCTAGTLTVTVTGSVSNADIRVANIGVSLPAYQAITTATSYDTTGFPMYLRFDGTDDSMATGTINPGSVDKVQVFAGVRKLSDAAIDILAELGPSNIANNGSWGLQTVGIVPNQPAFSSRGTVRAPAFAVWGTSPLTGVLTGLGDISGDFARLRVNGSQIAQSTVNQGTGNYLSYPLYIGRRGGSTLPFNGHLYSLVVRFSATNLPDATIAQTETWVNGKTGAY